MLQVLARYLPQRLCRLRVQAASAALPIFGSSAYRRLFSSEGKSSTFSPHVEEARKHEEALGGLATRSKKYVEKKYIDSSSFTLLDFDTLTHIKNLNFAIYTNVSMDDVSNNRTRTAGLAKTRHYFMENKEKLYVQNIATLFKAIIGSKSFQFQSKHSTFCIDEEWLDSIIATLKFNIDGNPLNDPSFKSKKVSKQIATLMFGLPIVERASLNKKVALLECINSLLRLEGVQLGPDSIALSFNGLRNMDRNVFSKTHILASLWHCLDKCNMEMTPQEISMTLAGFSRFDLHDSCVKDIVAAMAKKIKNCNQPFSSQAISVSLCGLQNFANNEDCVNALLKEIESRLVINEDNFNSIAISNGYFGMQRMTLDRPAYLRTILDSLAKKIQHSADGFDKVSVAKSLMGLSSMDLSSPLLEKSVGEITKAMVKSQELYEGDQVAMCLYAFKATHALNASSETLLRAVADKISTREGSRAFSKRHVTMAFSGLKNLSSASEEVRRVLSLLAPKVKDTFPVSVMEDSFLSGIVTGIRGMSVEHSEVRDLVQILFEKGLSPLVSQRVMSVDCFRSWCQFLSSNSSAADPPKIQMGSELVESIRSHLHIFLETSSPTELLQRSSAKAFVDVLSSFEDVKGDEALVVKLVEKLTAIPDLLSWGEFRAFTILRHMVSFEPFKYQPQRFIEKLIDRCGESKEKQSISFLKALILLSQDREISYSVLDFAKRQVCLSVKDKYVTKIVLHNFFLPLAKFCSDPQQTHRTTPCSDALMAKLQSQYRLVASTTEQGYMKVQLESSLRRYKDRLTR